MEKYIPVVVIKELSETDKILTALKNNDINCAEITFRTACAKEAIEYACKNYPDMSVGAGTVINGQQCKDALAAGAMVVGTGRSDVPNQINNVLAFPGIFKGALAVRASDINEAMKHAAAKAIASMVSDEQLSKDYIIPSALNKEVASLVANAVAMAAKESGVARI